MQATDAAARPAAEAARARSATFARTQAVAIGAAVFLSGAALLGVEIAASRVVAPYFGNSLFVWGALIGVVLTGLSIGYWVGGAVADRLPAPTLLFGVITLGGLTVAAVPLVDEAVLDAVVAWDPGPRLNPLVAAVALFGIPSVVLAAVTPVAVRLRATTLAHLGRTAGRLFSVSTAGSIVGTFATAFFLIPAFGTEQLFELAAATLFAAAAIVALLDRRVVAVAAALSLAAGAGYLATTAGTDAGTRLEGAAAQNWSPVFRERGFGHLDARDSRVGVADPSLDVVFSRDTQYHRLAVVDDEDTRYLRFDNSLQSAMYLDDPLATRFRYTDYFHLGLAYNPGAKDVLFVGLGAGSSPKRMLNEFGDLRLHSVELDPVVVDVAHRYFDVPRGDPRLEITVGDGRQFLSQEAKRWDVIAIDAFFADAVPFHLVTREFLELARTRLNPGGVIVTNAIGALDGTGSRLFRSIYKTYRSVYPTVLVHPVLEGDDRGDDAFRNLILVATDAAAPAKERLHERWADVRRRVPAAPDLERPILDRRDAALPTNDVPLLTDDYAPTDALLLLFQ